MQFVYIYIYNSFSNLHGLFSFVNIDIQPVSNPYECVFNANICYVVYFICVLVRYTATLVLDRIIKNLKFKW